MRMVTPTDLAVAEIMLLLELYHGSASRANRWIETPHFALGRKPPRNLLADAQGRKELMAYLRYEINGTPFTVHLLTRQLIARLSALPWSSEDLKTWLRTSFRFLSGKTPEQALNAGDFGRLRLMLGQISEGVFEDVEWPEPQGGSA